MHVQPTLMSELWQGRGERGGETAPTGPAKELGKDDFLILLTHQLKNQDPLKPMDGAEFTAELARFSSLEQLYNMNDNMEGLMDYQSSLNNGISAGIIGRHVRWGDGQSGRVTGVLFDEGATKLVVEDGTRVSLGEVREIYE